MLYVICYMLYNYMLYVICYGREAKMCIRVRVSEGT